MKVYSCILGLILQILRLHKTSFYHLSTFFPDIAGFTILGLAITWGWFFSSSPGIISKPEAIYDFIIVGGGTSGCVLASRLSETEYYKVLLIEAGPEEPWHSSIPLSSPLLQKSRFDWGYKTLPQKKSSFALHNQVGFMIQLQIGLKLIFLLYP